jgi:hypothetical protein
MHADQTGYELTLAYRLSHRVLVSLKCAAGSCHAHMCQRNGQCQRHSASRDLLVTKCRLLII